MDLEGFQFSWRELVFFLGVARVEDRHQAGRQRVFIQVLNRPLHLVWFNNKQSPGACGPVKIQL